jgi:hypothetical protein
LLYFDAIFVKIVAFTVYYTAIPWHDLSRLSQHDICVLKLVTPGHVTCPTFGGPKLLNHIRFFCHVFIDSLALTVRYKAIPLPASPSLSQVVILALKHGTMRALSTPWFALLFRTQETALLPTVCVCLVVLSMHY